MRSYREWRGTVRVVPLDRPTALMYAHSGIQEALGNIKRGPWNKDRVLLISESGERAVVRFRAQALARKVFDSDAEFWLTWQARRTAAVAAALAAAGVPWEPERVTYAAGIALMRFSGNWSEAVRRSGVLGA